jgi:hypothetical protein
MRWILVNDGDRGDRAKRRAMRHEYPNCVRACHGRRAHALPANVRRRAAESQRSHAALGVESHDAPASESRARPVSNRASARPCDEFGDPTFPVHRSFSIMVATHPAEVP